LGRQRRGFICSSDGENEGLTPVSCCEGSRKAGAAEVLREKKSKHKWLRLEEEEVEEEEEEEEDLDLVQLLSKQRVGSPMTIVTSTSLFLIIILLLALFVYSSEGLRKKARSLGYLCSLFSLRHRSQAGRFSACLLPSGCDFLQNVILNALVFLGLC
jgi:hypothetical protein